MVFPAHVGKQVELPERKNRNLLSLALIEWLYYYVKPISTVEASLDIHNGCQNSYAPPKITLLVVGTEDVGDANETSSASSLISGHRSDLLSEENEREKEVLVVVSS
ncbi:hypothetical protein L1987_72923 [Smallanthus sonchifolius]|uniref:Uncharacterized protein n=1 Tax=Smallanthus sonchifolius TaxID=185202 RepID=A0ACB9AXW3_9ASTR|nr:hypothetical protein L1987_72923 [Smallanthus sonchifolius]